MTKKLKLVWRLGKLPSPSEVQDLVLAKIITQEEAREILFSQETEEERDTKSLEAEIKFLRELVEKLANNQRASIIETIKYVEKPYYKYEWYKPYMYYATGGLQGQIYAANLNQQLTNGTLTSNGTSLAQYTYNATNGDDLKFSQIKTF